MTMRTAGTRRCAARYRRLPKKYSSRGVGRPFVVKIQAAALAGIEGLEKFLGPAQDKQAVIQTDLDAEHLARVFQFARSGRVKTNRQDMRNVPVKRAQVIA